MYRSDYFEGLLALLVEENRTYTGGLAAACEAYFRTTHRKSYELIIEYPATDYHEFCEMIDILTKADVEEFLLVDEPNMLLNRMSILDARSYDITNWIPSGGMSGSDKAFWRIKKK